MKDENLENSVITLHAKGWPIRKISKDLGISRGRVRRWLVSNSVLRDTTPGDEISLKKKRQSKLDPYKGFIAELLDKFLPVEEVNEEVFALAKNAFAMLDDKETLEVAAVEMMFKLKLLELSGFDIGADKVFLKNGLTSLKTKDFIEGNRVTEIDASYVKEINSVLDHYIVNVLEEELVSKKMMKDWK